jgi:hypothetical protein
MARKTSEDKVRKFEGEIGHKSHTFKGKVKKYKMRHFLRHFL